MLGFVASNQLYCEALGKHHLRKVVCGCWISQVGAGVGGDRFLGEHQWRDETILIYLTHFEPYAMDYAKADVIKCGHSENHWIFVVCGQMPSLDSGKQCKG